MSKTVAVILDDDRWLWAELTKLAAELDKTHPGAAASLREGMAETLTILHLGVPPTWPARSDPQTPSNR